jgi:hypothetical protein
MQNRLRGWVIAGSIGIGFAALEAQSAGTIQEASGDACKLLSAAQVTRVLGVPVDEGAYSLPGHPQFCVWREHGKPQMSAQNVQLNLLTVRQFDAPKTGPFMKGTESGLGDEAYWAYTPGFGFTLSVRKGGAVFRVQSRPIPEGMTRSSDTAEDKAKWDEKTKTVERAIAAEVLRNI